MKRSVSYSEEVKTTKPYGSTGGADFDKQMPTSSVQIENLDTGMLEEQETSRLPLKASTTALLVVDVQPEYWSRCPAVRKDFPNFEENLQRTIATARKKNIKIIWVRADYTFQHSPWLKQFEMLKNRDHHSRPNTMVELPCDPTDKDFGWEPFATPEYGENIIAKKSWSATNKTSLFDILRQAGIDTVLVCGLITSVCVQHTAFGVFEEGYRTLLVHDACGDRGIERHRAALELYGGYMYELISSFELADETQGLQKGHPVLNGSNTSTHTITRSDANHTTIQPRKVSIHSFADLQTASEN
jgi:nicotinamidase-related amidase